MAWTAPRTWVTGETVTAALMNTHIRDSLLAIGGTFVYKASDEIVNNSATLQDDDDLKFSVGTNELWLFQLVAHTTSASADVKYTFTVPASATMTWSRHPGHNTSDAFVPPITNAATDVESADAKGRAHNVWGRVDTAGTSGTVQFQWAQNSAIGSDTTVKAGSWLTAREVT